MKPGNEFDSLKLLEDAVLGACLAAPWHFGKVVDLINSDDFSGRANREIYQALVRMFRRGVPPDSVLLTVELCDSKKLSALEHVGRLLRLGVIPGHLQFYVEALLQRSKARQKALELVQSSNVITREPA